MPDQQKVADLMIPLEDYPRVPYWFTLSQAMGRLKEAAIKWKGNFEPRSVLVPDEKSHVMGILTLRDIIQGLAPRSLQEIVDKRQAALDLDSTLSDLGADFSVPQAKLAARIAVIEVMSPFQITVGTGISLTQALFLMIKNDVGRLPVMQGRKAVGIIRLCDLFRQISTCVLNDQ